MPSASSKRTLRPGDVSSPRVAGPALGPVLAHVAGVGRGARRQDCLSRPRAASAACPGVACTTRPAHSGRARSPVDASPRVVRVDAIEARWSSHYVWESARWEDTLATGDLVPPQDKKTREFLDRERTATRCSHHAAYTAEVWPKMPKVPDHRPATHRTVDTITWRRRQGRISIPTTRPYCIKKPSRHGAAFASARNDFRSHRMVTGGAGGSRASIIARGRTLGRRPSQASRATVGTVSGAPAFGLEVLYTTPRGGEARL